MTTIQRWTGREVRALREAKRMSIRAFADRLGVSERMVSKWEAGGENIEPRPVNQAALDTFLSSSNTEVHERFAIALNLAPTPADDKADESAALADESHQVRHPVDDKLMTFVGGGLFLCGKDNKPVSLPAFYIDVFPVTNLEYARFVAATGHQPPQHWKKGLPSDEIFDHPVVFVTWRDATAYATWAAKQLLTSQQWEKAARGTRGDIYPWGSQRTPAKCNVRESCIRSTTPVDRYHSGVSPTAPTTCAATPGNGAPPAPKANGTS